MEGEDVDDGFEPFDGLFHVPPRRPLNVVLNNPRENGVVEFLEAVRQGNLDEVRRNKLILSLYKAYSLLTGLVILLSACG